MGRRKPKIRISSESGEGEEEETHELAEENSRPFNEIKRRNYFTPEEDQLLLLGIRLFGLNNWNKVAALFPNRTSKQIQQHYIDTISEEAEKSSWSAEEDKLLNELYVRFGSRWSAISLYMYKRTPKSIRNRWHSLQKLQLNEEIDA